MKKQRTTIGLLIILLMFSCAQSEEPSFDMTYDSSKAMQTEEALFEMADEELIAKQVGQEEDIINERKLIKEGRVDFETNDINSTRALIFESIEKYNGYASSDKEYKSTGRLSNTIIIRVPAKNFDLLLSDATKGVTKFDNKNIEVNDVTEEFLDIQAQLKTKKELEIRYLELLKRANSVTEMLEVEKQIGLLRSEIESVEGRLKYLESKVSLSTLTMSFYQTVPYENEFGKELKDGFINGWDNLILFFVFLTNIWPFILLVIGLIFGFRMWRKRRKSRK